MNQETGNLIKEDYDNQRQEKFYDRYSGLIDVVEHKLIENGYTIFESDSQKGKRITIINSQSPDLIRETKNYENI